MMRRPLYLALATVLWMQGCGSPSTDSVATRAAIAGLAKSFPEKPVELGELQRRMLSNFETASRDAQAAQRNDYQLALIGASDNLCRAYEGRLWAIAETGQAEGLSSILLAVTPAASLTTEPAGPSIDPNSTRTAQSMRAVVKLIIRGIETRRCGLAEEMRRNRAKTIDAYPLDLAHQDAFSYHARCNANDGLSEASLALHLASDPSPQWLAAVIEDRVASVRAFLDKKPMAGQRRCGLPSSAAEMLPEAACTTLRCEKPP